MKGELHSIILHAANALENGMILLEQAETQVCPMCFTRKADGHAGDCHWQALRDTIDNFLAEVNW